MKKRIISGVAGTFVMIFLVTNFVSCSKDEVAVDGKIELTYAIWDESQAPVMEAMVKSYQENVNPNVTVKMQITSWTEYWTKLEASAIGGSAADIFWINPLRTEAYQEAGILYDLTDAVEKAEIGLDENFPPLLLSLYTIDGRIYAVSKDFDTNGLFYNKAIFDKANVAYPTDDWTIEDLAETAQQLIDSGLDAGTYAFTAANAGQTHYWPSIYAYGGKPLNDDKTESLYTDLAFEQGVQLWIDMIESGLSADSSTMAETEPDEMFEAGKLAMIIAGSYMVPEFLKNEEIRDYVDVVEYPSINGVEPNVINGLGFAVYADSPHKEIAAEMVAYFGSEEAMKIQGQSGVVISSRKDAHQYFAETESSMNLTAFTNHVDLAQTLPLSKMAAEITDAERRVFIDIYSLQTPVNEGLEEMKVRVDTILERMNR